MRCTSTEDLRNFGLLTDSGADITLLSIRSTQLQTQSIDSNALFSETPILNTTLKINHSESHSVVVCLHFLLRHYSFPDPSNS
jgi:hypothetical protein